MGVPNIFANASATIPLVQLDQNFATNITIGTTQVGLGNTANSITGLVNLTMTGNLNSGAQTWTPTLLGSITPGTPTYSLQAGNYWKVGNVVFVWGELLASLSGASGTLTVGGFPATAANSNPARGGLALIGWGGPTLTSGYVNLGLQMVANTTTAAFYESGSGQSLQTMGQSQLGSATLDIMFIGIYQST